MKTRVGWSHVTRTTNISYRGNCLILSLLLLSRRHPRVRCLPPFDPINEFTSKWWSRHLSSPTLLWYLVKTFLILPVMGIPVPSTSRSSDDSTDMGVWRLTRSLPMLLNWFDTWSLLSLGPLYWRKRARGIWLSSTTCLRSLLWCTSAYIMFGVLFWLKIFTRWNR